MDKTIHKLDLNGNLIWKYVGHTGAVRSISVDKYGYVYTASQDNTVHKLDSEGNLIWRYENYTSAVSSIFIDQYENVYSGDHDGIVLKLKQNRVVETYIRLQER